MAGRERVAKTSGQTDMDTCSHTAAPGADRRWAMLAAPSSRAAMAAFFFAPGPQALLVAALGSRTASLLCTPSPSPSAPSGFT